MSSIDIDYTPAILSALEIMRLGQLAIKEPGSSFKALAYKKAIDALRRLDKPVTSIADVTGLEGFGKKIIEKTAEIIATGTLASAEKIKATTNVGALDTLLKIHGIGPVKARALIASGINTIADLRTSTDAKLLTSAQKLGVKYFEDSLGRIPRAELVRHEALLLSTMPTGVSGTIVGSYRRGAASSGDIDILLTHTALTDPDAALRAFLVSLSATGYCVDTLVSGPKKWMGYVRIAADKPARRLDILITPMAEYPYAILYFTGSDKFNIAFRRHCMDCKYSLNEHTLTPTAPESILPPPMLHESDIFAFVGLKYVWPIERIDSRQIIKL